MQVLDKSILVFTDLDGTLLNHDDYSFEGAGKTLEYLSENNIPVIPVSSKTAEEIIDLRKRMDNEHPFIVENGAGVYLPKKYFDFKAEGLIDQGDYWLKSFSKPRLYFMEKLQELLTDYKGEFQSFSMMGVAAIAKDSGLAIEQAEKANKRQFSEPVKWLSSEGRKLQFIIALAQLGVNVLQGGRYLCLNENCDKGKAMQWLTNLYHENNGLRYQVIALGDSDNDIDMLLEAEYAAVIKSDFHAAPTLQKENIYWSENTGCEGWAESIKVIMEKYDG